MCLEKKCKNLSFSLCMIVDCRRKLVIFFGSPAASPTSVYNEVKWWGFSLFFYSPIRSLMAIVEDLEWRNSGVASNIRCSFRCRHHLYIINGQLNIEARGNERADFDHIRTHTRTRHVFILLILVSVVSSVSMLLLCGAHKQLVVYV